MPLYQKKPFPLVEKPKDLKPHELLFQIRFSKEIFRDYSEYLKRLNLYRKRVWKCKATGKINLTYEEALVSEKKAAEKVQKFPKELVATVLCDVQFSMASLKDLVNGIVAKLQGPFSEGCELYGRKNGRVYPCKIVNILEDDGGTQYEVAWLDKDKKVTGNANLKREELIRNKLPFSREVLKSFIRESTYRNVPWVIHERLAKQHGISTDPPKELKNEISVKNGLVVCNRKKKKNEDGKNIMEADGDLAKEEPGTSTSGEIVKSLPALKFAENQEGNVQEMKYPIDDLLVPPADDDRSLTERPSPCRDFNVPIDCVGDLLMVWDFCTSFGRLLHLSPFSLEDFENALCHKDSNLVLIAESHSALLRLLIKDNGEYSMAIQKKKRKNKITLVTWGEYLCDFLELCGIAELSTHSTTIKRGHYGLLDIHVKLRIFGQLIAQTLETDIFREKMDESIDERQALAAAKRDEAIEEGRKRREEKRLKTDPDNKELTEGCGGESDGNDPASRLDQNHGKQNGDVSSKWNGKEPVNRKKHLLEHSENEEVDDTAKKISKKQRTDGDLSLENVNDSKKRAVHKMMKNEIKEMIEKKSKEQRKEYLEREIEKRYIRTNPLGKDRDHNRYWFFKRDGRIFVESSDSMLWGYYCTKEELDALLGSLNPKGVRERALKKQLEKFYNKICLELQKRAKDAAQRIAMEEAVLRRSTRIRAPPRDNPAVAFLKYSNKWKED